MRRLRRTADARTARARYELLRFAGLCVKCKAPVRRVGVLCTERIEKRRARERAAT